MVLFPDLEVSKEPQLNNSALLQPHRGVLVFNQLIWMGGEKEATTVSCAHQPVGTTGPNIATLLIPFIFIKYLSMSFLPNAAD